MGKSRTRRRTSARICWIQANRGQRSFIVGAKNVDIPPEFWDNKDSLGITLSEGKKAILEQYSSNKTSGFKLLESNMTTLDGNPASKIVYLLKPDAESEIEEKYTVSISFKDNVQHRFLVLYYLPLLPRI